MRPQPRAPASLAARIAVFAYGLAAYVLFVAAFVYAAGFANNLFVPRSIDSAPTALLPVALLVNAGLLAAFAIQHTIMARPAFKAAFTRLIPRAAERSTFVLIASALLFLIFWQWRAMPATLWHVQAAWGRVLLHGLSLAGFGLALYSSCVIDHFDLFGLRQVWSHLRGKPLAAPPFAERSVYRQVRHPLMLGFLIGFWSTPDMTLGHLLFAGLTSVYILVGVWIEERDLVRQIGLPYLAYRARTPMLLPRLGPAALAGCRQVLRGHRARRAAFEDGLASNAVRPAQNP